MGRAELNGQTMRTPTFLVIALLVAIGLPGADGSPPLPQAPGAGPTLSAQWAEVLTATDKWLVLRSQDGEQYPVSYDAIGQFLVRWPTTVDRISPAALLEATGTSVGSNRLLTNQVDVYEGASRDLVVPGLLTTTNMGYPVTSMDFVVNADAYGAPFPGVVNPIQGGQYAAGRQGSCGRAPGQPNPDVGCIPTSGGVRGVEQRVSNRPDQCRPQSHSGDPGIAEHDAIRRPGLLCRVRGQAEIVDLAPSCRLQAGSGG